MAEQPGGRALQHLLQRRSVNVLIAMHLVGGLMTIALGHRLTGRNIQTIWPGAAHDKTFGSYKQYFQPAAIQQAKGFPLNLSANTVRADLIQLTSLINPGQQRLQDLTVGQINLIKTGLCQARSLRTVSGQIDSLTPMRFNGVAGATLRVIVRRHPQGATAICDHILLPGKTQTNRQRRRGIIFLHSRASLRYSITSNSSSHCFPVSTRLRGYFYLSTQQCP